MTFMTQMAAAKAGIITKQMKIVAQEEGMAEERLRQLVAEGKVVIPANRNHKCLHPHGIGQALKTKINVNLGTSRDCLNFETEMA